MSKPYGELLTQAEAAVGSVKDPELRRIAFERVLNDLLEGAAGDHQNSRRIAKANNLALKSGTRGTISKPSRRAVGPYAYVNELAQADFFKKPKSIGEVKTELENQGHHIPLTSISGPMQKLCQRKILRRQKSKVGNKSTFTYSNW